MTLPELLAHHYTKAGQIDEAIGYWQQAGQRASERSAYQEAINHLRTGLTLLQKLPETQERHHRELPLQTLLGTALLVAKGHAAHEVEDTFTQARVLCQRLGETQDAFPVLFGMWRFYVARPDLSKAQQLSEDLLGLAERHNEASFYIAAHYACGLNDFLLGKLNVAHSHLQEGIVRDHPHQPRSPLFRAGQDPGVACRMYAAWTRWVSGYPDQALAYVQEALVLATDIAHPYSYAFALNIAASVYLFRGEWQHVYSHAETAITLSTEQGFTLWLAFGTWLQGWALMAQGQHEEGLRQMRQGSMAWRGSGAETGVPHQLALLAEGYRVLHQVEAGLNALKEGFEIMERTGEHVFQAELHRLNGQLLLVQSANNVTEAETCYRQALDISRQQRAKSWELRAATSLATLWQQQGKRQEAYDLLAPIYDWFTEGFDTADLIEAKSLLNDLEGPRS
jgi:predicted ATPase